MAAEDGRNEPGRLDGIDLQSETGLKQKKDGSRGPGLWRTGQRIKDGTFAGHLLKTTKQLRHSMEIEMKACLEQTREQFHCLVFETIASESQAMSALSWGQIAPV